jgi:hypothetical protein
VVLGPRRVFQGTAGIHSIRIYCGDCLMNIFGREAACEKELRNQFANFLCD